MWRLVPQAQFISQPQMTCAVPRFTTEFWNPVFQSIEKYLFALLHRNVPTQQKNWDISTSQSRLGRIISHIQITSRLMNSIELLVLIWRLSASIVLYWFNSDQIKLDQIQPKRQIIPWSWPVEKGQLREKSILVNVERSHALDQSSSRATSTPFATLTLF